MDHRKQSNHPGNPSSSKSLVTSTFRVWTRCQAICLRSKGSCPPRWFPSSVTNQLGNNLSRSLPNGRPEALPSTSKNGEDHKSRPICDEHNNTLATETEAPELELEQHITTPSEPELHSTAPPKPKQHSTTPPKSDLPSTESSQAAQLGTVTPEKVPLHKKINSYPGVQTKEARSQYLLPKGQASPYKSVSTTKFPPSELIFHTQYSGDFRTT
ncbi:hypothetical protein COOONC_22393 [Cooperia oncophora]